MSVTIKQIDVEKDIIHVKCSNEQWAKIHKFAGNTHYSEVSDFIPKSSLIPVWKLIDWTLSKEKLTERLSSLLGTEIKTTYEL